MKLLAATLCCLLASPAWAEGSWNCRNADLEIACNEGKCQANESFTPMDVAVGEDGGLTVCAYSGCWDGQGKVQRTDNFLMVAADGLDHSAGSEDGDPPAVAITIDLRSGLAAFNGMGYAMPMTCEASEPQETPTP